MKEKTTKDIIFREAAKLFSELGYENTSMRVIAEKSGITKPAIYYYFPNKQRIFEELLQYAMDKARENLKRIYQSDKSPIQKIRELIISRFNGCKQNPELSRFVFDAISGNIRQDISFDIMKEFYPQRLMMEEIIEEGRKKGLFREDFDVECFQNSLVGALNLFIMGYLKFGIGDLNEEVAEGLMDLFLKGIGKNYE